MTHGLSNLKSGSHVGRYLGLTGHRLNAADCLNFGIATHFVSQKDLEDVFKNLEKNANSDKPVTPEGVAGVLEVGLYCLISN